MIKVAKWLLLVVVVGSVISASAFAARRYWPRELIITPLPQPAVWEMREGRAVLRPVRELLLAQAAAFDDELTAYLFFGYFKSRSEFAPHEVLLTTKEEDGQPVYHLLLAPKNNDFLSAVASLSELVAAGLISGYDLKSWPEPVLENKRLQTRTFEAAYRLPVTRRLEALDRTELTSLVEKFILFKSRTDARVRSRGWPGPEVLSADDARAFAADIITVAEFYSLPLDLFLAIGAIENNYMNVPGDLEHAVWKRRPRDGDIVLQRRRGRALVLNYASGPWQITRETLRYVHKLYLKDERDYSALPERLRPPRELNLSEVDPHHLTTYAGLLFRHLLDRFDGDLAKAVGAYNGGIGNPNAKYEETVRLIAGYARRVIEQAAALNNRAVADTRFFAPSPD